jgi:predicted DNA-binding transcriptional regulator AlpA
MSSGIIDSLELIELVVRSYLVQYNDSTFTPPPLRRKESLMSFELATRNRQTAPDLLTLEQLISLTGWGRTATYSRARSDGLPFPVLKAGTRYYISRAAYERWLAGERATNGEQGTA